MNKASFTGRANLAARELLSKFCDKHAEEMRVKPHGFHEGHVEAAAEIIVKWLWREEDQKEGAE